MGAFFVGENTLGAGDDVGDRRRCIGWAVVGDGCCWSVVTEGGAAGAAPAGGPTTCSAPPGNCGAPGAEGVVAGQRILSANAERDLRSCKCQKQNLLLRANFLNLFRAFSVWTVSSFFK